MSSHFVTALVVALVCAHFCDAQKIKGCPENEKEVRCGRYCERSCKYPQERHCNAITNDEYCNNDCQCIDPYVRNNLNGKCILVEDCPKAHEKV